MLQIEEVRVALGGVPVVDGVSMAIEPGEIVAILGPSGAGKTTLLRAITGFQRIDSGRIVLEGRDVASPRECLAPDKRRVTIVPQEHALFPHLSVAANIGYGVPKMIRQERVTEMIALTRLSGLENRMPHELSGGQQQRVALARALAPRPALTLLDEPFTGLDAGLRETVRLETSALLRSLQMTAIIVTHDQEEALSIADRVAVLRDGRLVQCDTPNAVYLQPNDLDTAEFVGEANVFAISVEDSRGSCVLGTFDLPERQSNPLVAMFRPEQLLPEDRGPVSATVEDVTYFGHDAMLVTMLDNGDRLRVRTQGSVIPRDSRIRLRVEGDPCYFDLTTGQRVG